MYQLEGVLFHVTLNETKIPPINVFQPANGVSLICLDRA